MKTVLSLSLILLVFSCSTKKQNQESPSVRFDLMSVRLYEDSLDFKPYKVIELVPNTDEITEIADFNNSKVGMKYFLDSLHDELQHNVVFYKHSAISWSELTSYEHRENFNYQGEFTWIIESAIDNETYFKVALNYDCKDQLADL